MKIKVGVIGAGSWGKNHVRVYSELPTTKLAFVVDLNRARAKGMARRYGVRWYTDYSEAIKKEKIDAVSICTPTSTHMKIAEHVLKNGVNVLLEKPFTGSPRNAERLKRLAESMGLVLMPGFIERFNPTLGGVKKSLRYAGEVYVIEAERMSRRRATITDVDVLGDLAIHDVDLIRTLVNEDYVEVFGHVNTLFNGKPDDALLLLKTSGPTVVIRASWHSYHKVRKLKVYGSKATISADYLTQEITVYGEKRIIKPLRKWREPLKEELRHFSLVVSGKAKPVVTPSDAIYALKILEAALKSQGEGFVKVG